MSEITQRRTSGSSSILLSRLAVARNQLPDFSEATVSILLIVLSLLIFHILTGPLAILHAPTSAAIAASAIISIAGLRWTWKTLPLPFYLVVLAINICCVAYLSASWWTHETSFAEPTRISGWLPIAAGVLGFRWPVLTIAPALAVAWSKVELSRSTGMPLVGSSDYIIIPELAVIVAIFMAVFSVYQLASTRAPLRRLSKPLNAAFFFSACVIVAAGIHFSNYFWSGWQKIFLTNATPLTWVLENPTYMLAVHTFDFNYLTIQTLLGGGDWFFATLEMLNVPLNVFVLIIQLLALVVLLSLRASAITTFFYDVMHTAIFALTGIFFWKWIILNVGFLMAFNSLRRNGQKPPLPVLVLGCLLVLVAPLSFHIVWLAWFDSGGVNDAHFEAKTSSGETIRIPSNYFLGASIYVAQQRLARPFTGPLPTRTWGTTTDAKVMHRLMSPDCAADLNSIWTLASRDRARIERLIRHQHAVALGLVGADGVLAYDRYPHHIWSSPWHFPRFAALDLRTITSYVLVVEARCVSIDDNGRISRTSVGRSSYEFPVEPR